MRNPFSNRPPKRQIVAGPLKQPDTLPGCLEMCERKYKKAEVLVCRKDLKNPSYKQVATMGLHDLRENYARIEDFIRQYWGGGQFRIEFREIGGATVGRYPFSIEGKRMSLGGSVTEEELAERAAERKRKEEEKAEKEQESKRSDRLLELLIESKPGMGDIIVLADKMSEKAASSNGKGDDEWKMELITNLYNNMLTIVQAQSGGSPMEDALKMLQLAREMGPQVAPDDTLNTLIQSLVPVLGQVLLSRRTGKAPALTPEMLAQARRSMEGLKDYVELAPPGAQAEQAAQAEKTMETLGRIPSEAPQAAEPPAPTFLESPTQPEPPPINYKYIMDKYRNNIAAGADPFKLAGDLVDMVSMAEEYMPDTAPAVIAGFVNQRDPLILLREYQRFCAAIPELARNPELAQSMGAALMQILGIETAQYPYSEAEETEAEDVPDTENTEASDAGDEVEPVGAADAIDPPGPRLVEPGGGTSEPEEPESDERDLGRSG